MTLSIDNLWQQLIDIFEIELIMHSTKTLANQLNLQFRM